MQKVQYWLQPCMMLTKAVTDFPGVAVEHVLADVRLAPLLFLDIARSCSRGRRECSSRYSAVR